MSPPPGSVREATLSMRAVSRHDYGVMALSSVEDTVENMESSDSPTNVSEPTAATDTSAAIRPYSMAVAPDSSFKKLSIKVYILITQGLTTDNGEIMASVLRIG